MSVYRRATVVGVALASAAMLLGCSANWENQRDETFTINRSERVCESGSHGDCKYLVFANTGVYENTDNSYHGKYNSSDIYNQLVPGHTYTCNVVGNRNPRRSMYPNILSCAEVPAK